jgi:hypothetical protein
MRYYDITLTKSDGTTLPRRWTSHPNGVFDPGALNIEFDIPVATFGIPMGGQSILIEGVPLQDLLQPQNFAGLNLLMKGGMQAGLPLSNPKQSGILVSGQIWQSFGNWEGTDMTLDFVINPGGYSINRPGNFVLNWTAGMPLAQALQQTLQVAYPNTPISMNISNQLVQNHTEPHHCSTLDQLAQFILEVTQGHFLGQNYPGVSIAMQGGQLIVFDSTYQPPAIQLAPTDLVGQPTWIQPNTMQIKLVMRGDIQLGSMVTMPKNLMNAPEGVLTLPNAFPSSIKYQPTFTGTFRVVELRHVGSFRSSSGADWVTIANCILPTQPGT